MSFVLIEIEFSLGALKAKAETHLIVSEGVTAKMASVIPAPRPAISTLYGGRGVRLEITHTK